MQLLKKNKTFEGETCVYSHESQLTQTPMKFSCFLPRPIEEIDSCIIWLSGLTCTEENFITKAGAQRILKNSTTMILCPDTSPRGLNLPKEHDDYDFGSGASFYVNATTEGYRDHYKMYDYIAQELPVLIKNHFKVDKLSLMGHSMGGHGALILGLREPQLFKSVSAFAPIVHPTKCAWGQKAFKGYLGANEDDWKSYDATELVALGQTRADELLIDQGLNDEFYPSQLRTEDFETICQEKGQKLKIRYLANYDHSYYTIATFVEDHIKFHQERLGVF